MIVINGVLFTLLRLDTGSSHFSSNCTLVVTQQASEKPSDSHSCFSETFPLIISPSFMSDEAGHGVFLIACRFFDRGLDSFVEVQVLKKYQAPTNSYLQ